MTHTPEILRFPVAVDDRGSLIPIEFADVPFTVRRTFVVTGPSGGSERGNHTVPCAQLLCLVSGSAAVQLGADEATLSEPALLVEPGQSVLLAPGSYVRYTLADASSVLLVLAEQPYARREG
jgi:hypothetical protein